MELTRRFLKPPPESFFLLGPRGTGKSTWTQAMFPEALRLDLLDPELFRSYSSRPEHLAELVHGNPLKKTILIDEVQKVPDLLPVVHSLIEEKEGRRFILTGSSARKLKRTGADLLAGRAVLRSLHPFMASELGPSFDLERALNYGTLPLIWWAENPKDVLKAYAALYLREEVQMEGLVRNIGNFARFLEAVSFSQASVLNTSNVARESQVERKVIEGYLTILEDLLIGVRLPIFTKRAKREVSVHPKFFFFDCGVYRSIRPQGQLDKPEEIHGPALETLVLQHLRAWSDYSSDEAQISFWRTRQGVEVDFIVYGKQGLWAIEVKNTNRVRPEDLRGLNSFKQDYPEAVPILLYRGKERLRNGDIHCIPCDQFLPTIVPGKSLL